MERPPQSWRKCVARASDTSPVCKRLQKTVSHATRIVKSAEGVVSDFPAGTTLNAPSLHLIGNGYLDGLRRETSSVATCLVAQLAYGCAGTGLGIRRHFKVRHDVEIACKHRQRLFAELVLLKRRLRVGNLPAFERTGGVPGELQRNQVLI